IKSFVPSSQKTSPVESSFFVIYDYLSFVLREYSFDRISKLIEEATNWFSFIHICSVVSNYVEKVWTCRNIHIIDIFIDILNNVSNFILYIICNVMTFYIAAVCHMVIRTTSIRVTIVNRSIRYITVINISYIHAC